MAKVTEVRVSGTPTEELFPDPGGAEGAECPGDPAAVSKVRRDISVRVLEGFMEGPFFTCVTE